MEVSNGVLTRVYNEDINEDGSFHFPEGLHSIGSGAFKRCTSLSHIELPEGICTIGGAAFWDCTSLSHIGLPQGLQSIGMGAFYNCTSLSHIGLPQGLQSIEMWAFNNCTSLSHINLPAGLQSIGLFTFVGCPSLSNIVIPSGNEEEYQRLKAELPVCLLAVADRTREELMQFRNTIGVLGQASRTGFFAHETNGVCLIKDILNIIAQQLVFSAGLADIITPDEIQRIFEYGAAEQRTAAP